MRKFLYKKNFKTERVKDRSQIGSECSLEISLLNLFMKYLSDQILSYKVCLMIV